MRIDEKDEDALKAWVVKKLENISDADPEVLGEYIVVLLRNGNDSSDEQVKQDCLENLSDFLKDHTQKFVDDIFAAIQSKSFLASETSPPKTLTPTAPSFNPPTGPAARFGHSLGPNGLESQSQLRKRSWNNREESLPTDGRDAHYNRDDRNIKQMRRGGRTQDGFGGSGGQRGPSRGQQSPIGGMPGQGQVSMPQTGGFPQIQAQQPAFPPFDPNEMAALMAMTAAHMGFPNLPGQPQFSPNQPTSRYQQYTGRPMPPKKLGQRCRDYDNQGFCVRGSSCPYEHGNDRIVVPSAGAPEEYDPTNASLSTVAAGQSPTRTFNNSRGRSDRGRGDRRHDRGGRASFSMAGPNYDHSNTTIVVEQIPEEKFTEEDVRGFFGEFGKILEVNMKPYKRLAIVKYEDFFGARNAYHSPKTIFDNRFVKVYWYKPEQQHNLPSASAGAANGTNPATSKTFEAPEQKGDSDEMQIDMAEFTAKQAEAQKVHEEKLKKLQEAETRKEELLQKVKQQAEERKKLMAKLKLKEQPGKSSTALANGAGQEVTEANGGKKGMSVDEKSSTTDTLKAKLAELEAEAESRGMSLDEPLSEWGSFRGRGRGAGYRGRGTYVPFGRGFNSYRGAAGYRGRGGAPYVGGGVMRLDNRPKRVSVSLSRSGQEEWDEKKDEALRVHLMNNFEIQSVEPHPQRKDVQVVTFKERYVAETFLANTSVIEGVGKVDVAWVPNTTTAPAPIIAAPPVAKAESTPTVIAGEAKEGMNESKDNVTGDTEKNEQTKESKESKEPKDAKDVKMKDAKDTKDGKGTNEDAKDDDEAWMDVA
ncbi:hypothetical protein NA57DRAFT_73138 [Rhizodiscina lignyota]|uniref:Uncharacterized protein n=1 Tax=Rhizodiscina lignyota TaxID=1504668 RepID=A0A9P4IIF8_9PEZI|nr:hypothetical protein NA57DRAFT_73138 [Rhizodiscina lignyota]